MKKRLFALVLAAAAALLLVVPQAAAETESIRIYPLPEGLKVYYHDPLYFPDTDNDFSNDLIPVYLPGESTPNLFGAVDKNGTLVIPTEYDRLQGRGERLLGTKGDQLLLLDQAGQVIADLSEYDDVFFSDDGETLDMRKDGESITLDKNGAVLEPSDQPEPEEGAPESLQVLKAENGVYGYVDADGKVVIPCQFRYAEAFSGGLAVVATERGFGYGFIDVTGKVVIPCQFRYAEAFSGGLAAVATDNDSFGFIDETGQEIVPCQYTHVGRFLNGDLLGIRAAGGRVYSHPSYDESGNWLGTTFNLAQVTGEVTLEFFHADGTPAGGPLALPEGTEHFTPYANGMLHLSRDDGEFSSLIDYEGNTRFPKGGTGKVHVRFFPGEECFFLVVRSTEQDKDITSYTYTTTGSDGITYYGAAYLVDMNGESNVPQLDAKEPFHSGVACGVDMERGRTVFFDSSGRELFFINGYNAALSGCGRLGWSHSHKNGYGVFENPCYKSDYVPGDELTAFTGHDVWIISSGDSPSGGSATSGGASGNEGGGFPVLPVVGGAAAIAAVVVLSKKKHR